MIEIHLVAFTVWSKKKKMFILALHLHIFSVVKNVEMTSFEYVCAQNAS